MSKRKFTIHNKSNRPDNIVYKEQELIEQCIAIENQLPAFMGNFFLYLKNAVALSTRAAYLEDILFFCKYLVNDKKLTEAENTADIKIIEFNSITSRDINNFIGNYCSRYIVKNEKSIKVMENNTRTLSRKKSSLSVLFKYLYRDEMIEKNITDGFNPIKLPKPQPDAIKRLDIDEVVRLLDLIDSGELLNEKERVYWEKTKYRDRAIVVLLLTYGLRVSELQQLNISSFNFHRGEFKIFRKRGKEVLMPINKTCERVIKEYIDKERSKIHSEALEDKDALFLSMQKRRMTVRAIRNLTKKYTSFVMGQNKDNGFSPHKLRATAATSLIQQGFSIYDVQNLLDHDNITTTQLYAAHRKDVKREIVKNFEWLDD